MKTIGSKIQPGVWNKMTAISTAVFLLIFTVIPSWTFAETIDLEGGSVDVSVQDNTTNWNVTGNPVWNIPEFNVAQGSIYNIAGLGNGASLALLVNGGQASNIFGTMNLSNLAFILQNIAGINIGSSAMINLNNASLIASTLPLNLNVTDFLKQQYEFSGQGGFLTNDGKIVGNNADLVALVANAIENKGTIEVPMGTVALAAGDVVSIGISPDGMVSIAVDEATANTMGLSDQIKNSGTISAQGGRVVLDAKAIDGLFDKAINLTAEPNAVSVVKSDDGIIEFVANGDILNQGTLQAERGSITIETTRDIETKGILRAGILTEHGYTFKIGGVVEVGRVLMDNLDGAAKIQEGAQISGEFTDGGEDGGNIIVEGNFSLLGDTLLWADHVNNGSGAIQWSEVYTLTGNNRNLTLKASEDSIVGAITGVNLLTLDKNTGKTPTYTGSAVDDIHVDTIKTMNGVAFFKTVGTGADEANARLIYDATQLQAMQNNLGYYYKLANNIDASETISWNEGLGFMPVGNHTLSFTGGLDGNNHTISELFIDRQSTTRIGLFGAASGAIVQNIGLLNVNIRGDFYVGGLIGYNSAQSRIVSSYVTGSVSGGNSVGILIGRNDNSDVVSSYSAGSVSGNEVGGLIGTNWGSNVISSYSTGSVTGGHYVGGLVGNNTVSSIIVASHATGNVSGAGNYVGGLVGGNMSASSITSSYATGSVGGSSFYTGGLVGYNHGSSIVSSYATGIVSGAQGVGGLVGMNFNTSSILNSYATGNVSGVSSVGGLIGIYSSGTLTNNYWNIETSGQAHSAGEGANAVEGKTTTEMEQQSTFSGWDFNGLWKTGASYPILIWQDIIGGGTASNPWLITTVNELQYMSYALGGSFKLANDIAATETSSWNAGAGFNPVGNSSTRFTGIFDGDYHTISGLFIDRQATTGIGLFGYTNGAIIQNVGLLDANIRGNNYVGGLVGCNNNGSNVINSYVVGNLNGNFAAGGLVGYNAYGATITDSYAAVSITSTSLGYSGALVGFNGGIVANSHYDINAAFVNGEQIVARFGLYQDQYADWLANGKMLDIYDYYENDGTHFLINELADLKNFLGFSEMAESFKLTDSIDLSEAPGFYIPYLSVAEFDGNGYTISNLHLDLPTTDDVGLFGYVTGSTIKNIGAVGGSVTGGNNVGGLAGRIFSSFIENVYSTNNTSNNGWAVGGLVGSTSASTITNSYAIGGVSGYEAVGGLVGFNISSTISNSYAVGSVSGSSSVGGFVGYNENSAIVHSYSTGNVSGDDNVGGFIGYYDSGMLTNNYWGIETSGQVYSGGEGANAVEGKTTAEMTQRSTFSGWDFVNIWNSHADALPTLEGGDGAWGYIISGLFDRSVSGIELTLSLNGSNIGSVLTEWDGSFSFSNIELSGGEYLLIYVNNSDSYHGGLIGQVQLVGDITGLALTDGYFTFGNSNLEGTSIGTSFNNADLVAAYDGNAGSLYSTNLAGNISFAGDTTVQVPIPVTYTMDDSASVVNVAGNILNQGAIIQETNLAIAGDYTQESGATFIDEDPMSHDFSVDGSFSIPTEAGAFNRYVGVGEEGDPYMVRDVFDLQAMNGFLSSYFGLADDIDASSTVEWNPSWLSSRYSGFMPIGSEGTAFTGFFDGQGHTISSLFVNRSGNLGLFGYTDEATLKNVILDQFSIQGRPGSGSVGALAGHVVDTNIDNVTVMGGEITLTSILPRGVSGDYIITDEASAIDLPDLDLDLITSEGVGLLVGSAWGDSSISESSSSGSISNSRWDILGGLVGLLADSTISGSFSTASLSGHNFVGGLVGINWNGVVEGNSYAAGAVTGAQAIGGLVGAVLGGNSRLSDVHAASDVTGVDLYYRGNTAIAFLVGGLVGYSKGADAENKVIIQDSYATGTVTATTGTSVGGFAGGIYYTEITDSYATGNVEGYHSVGGFVGRTDLDSYITGSALAETTKASGTVTGVDKSESERSEAVGGFVGWHTNSTIEFSHARGDVTGYNGVGGFTGMNNQGTVYDSSALEGYVDGTIGVGGFIGVNNSGTYARNIWDETLNAHLLPIGGSVTGQNGAVFTYTTEVDRTLSQWNQWAGQYFEPPVPVQDPGLEEDLNKQYDELNPRSIDGLVLPEVELPNPLAKFVTDVFVREGSVYVLDGINDSSLLTQGESMRVNFKKMTAGAAEKAPGTGSAEPVLEPAITTGGNQPVESASKPFIGWAKPVAPVITDLMAGGNRYGVLKKPDSSVFVKSRGSETWQSARDGMVILPGDEVRTADSASVKIALEEGKVGTVEIKGGSLFRINKAETDPETGDKTTLLDLAIGKVLVHAGKLQGASKFEVRTPTALTGVRGTIFEVTVKEKA